MIEEVKSIQGSSEQTDTATSGQVKITRYTEEEAKQRAKKVWVICWILAGLSIFLPVAHFFLVPAFLISGPVAYSFLKNSKSAIKTGSLPCPHCQEVNEMTEGPESWPVSTICEKCRKSFLIKLAA